MIKLKTLTARNFMSVGNVTQAVDFDRDDLTLVLGQNLDLGGDGSRNGTGKTTIINALSYALYGQALTNIRRDNLVNKTNGKNMLCSLDFSINDINYRIERGRKPNILKLYVNEQEQELDESQGDSRETQSYIEGLLGLKHDMFKHILALNTYTEPFLSMRANDQRSIIEQLLGITVLSEKADRIKEEIKQTKDAVKQEQFKIQAQQESNKHIQDQIDSLKKRQKMWLKKHGEDIAELESAIEELAHVDINAELQQHRVLQEYKQKQSAVTEAEKWIASIERDNAKQQKLSDKLKAEIQDIQDHKCYACGQDLHDSKQDEILKSKQDMLQESALQILSNQTQADEHQAVIQEIGKLGDTPVTYYATYEDALNHKSSLEALAKSLESKINETDPYGEQIVDFENTGLKDIDYNSINELNKIQEHQEFLLKLLTGKDSFIRKKIIDQNLSYLNGRLTHYLDRVGLPHSVVFQNDLSVEITELGRDLDFDNLSRGERNRLILSMSWAFRDVWESLYHSINVLFIDELVDSGMDTAGVESSIALLKRMCRERHKSVWLVSHKDELSARVHNILHVIKENGFTSYNTDVDIAY